jgi:DNA polymerase
VRTLAIDIETFSSADLTKTGVYKYTEAPDFTILLFAYSFEGAPRVIDLASGEEIPDDVLNALTDPNVLKTAYNANFERTCIAKYLKRPMPPEQWECTMVKAAMIGLPHGLDAVAMALKLEGKLAEGKALIRYFSCTCKPTKTNGQRTRNLPGHDTEMWEKYKSYCAQDVVTERRIADKISFFEIPELEKRLWALDQKINDRGVRVDRKFIQNAISFDITTNKKLTEEAVRLTGLDNPNSVSQLKKWIEEATGDQVEKLTKHTVPEILKSAESEVVKRVLEIRQMMSKSSVKKYIAMARAVCEDGRIRGLLQFYGAGRTGRWAGRLVQVQNLPKNELKDLDLARSIVRSGDLEHLEMMFGNVPDTLSQLTRTAFVPAKGRCFIVSDFSAIEARVIAWLAGEKWRLEVFKTHGKIYEASASQMFKIPLEKIDKKSPYRFRGKISELALGYQGGPGAIERMEISTGVAIKDRIPADERPKIVSMWRNANTKIVQLWETVNDAVFSVVDTGQPATLPKGMKAFIQKRNPFHSASKWPQPCVPKTADRYKHIRQSCCDL